MSQRMPASMSTHLSLSDLIEGRLSSRYGRGELARLATQLIVEKAPEVESRDARGRAYYEHGAESGPAEDRGGDDRVRGTADRGPGRAIPLRHPRASVLRFRKGVGPST